MQLSFCICLKKKNVSRKNKDIIQNGTMNNDTLEAHGRFDWGLRGENKVMEALLFHFLQRSAVKSHVHQRYTCEPPHRLRSGICADLPTKDDPCEFRSI